MPGTLPPLTNWNPTKETLHAYSRVIGAIPRAHSQPHPKWWHISLKVTSNGLATDPIPTPDGQTMRVVMDLRNHQIFAESPQGVADPFDMTLGAAADELASQLFGTVASYGLPAAYNEAKFANADPRQYNPQHAESFLNAIQQIDRIFKVHKSNLSGETGPVQLWPHGFDIAFEWFGTRVETYEEDGKTVETPSQINFGWSPGDASHPQPYFYSNPWPFEPEITQNPLPDGARWFTDNWNGSILPYDQVAGKPNADEQILAYAQAVYASASPTLLR